MKNANINLNVCCHLLTVGGHEETSVDLFGVTEVWLNLLPAGIELPLMDAAGFDVQHIETDLSMTAGHKATETKCCLFLSICVYVSSVQNANTDKEQFLLYHP